MAALGSQIMLLKHLSGKDNKVEIDELMAYYEIAKNSYPQIYENYQFSQWLSFMANNHLIEITNEGTLITVEGRALLQYQIDRGYQQNRIY